MDGINIPFSPDTTNHVCTSQRTGDWIVFRCHQCEDYERRINWRTGEMKVQDTNPDVAHFGSHFPEEYKDAFTSTN